MSISENVKNLLGEIAAGNGRGEAVTLVAATKTRTPEEINEAIAAGIADIGENRVQEFREKFALVNGARRHFIGRLQLNKVKYLVGKTDLIHSVDRDELAAEISRFAERQGVRQPVLLQVNAGMEETKGGYAPKEALFAYERMASSAWLAPCGLMAMLPETDDKALLDRLAEEMRAIFDATARRFENVRFLSMGMSGDWRLCLGHGANMIRLGTAIFGERNTAARS